jgi:hypothetical protein
MEAAWRALAIEHDWLNGEIVENARKRAGQSANCRRDYPLWNLALASFPPDHVM